MLRFHTVGCVLTLALACGSHSKSTPSEHTIDKAPTPTATPVDAAVVDEKLPKLACDAETSIVSAPVPEPTWFCAKADGTKHGPFVTQYPDGTIAVGGLYKNGALDGAWERRHPNGNVAEVGVYGAGVKHGKWKQLDPNGKVLGEYELANGSGVERRWLDDGTLYSEVAFKAGIEHGAAKFFERGTLIASSKYSNGKLDGTRVTGTHRSLKFEEKYAAGTLTGVRKIWNGYTLLAHENFDRRGKHDGAYKLWRTKKVVRVEGRFAHGKRVGAWVWHDREGNKEREGSYIDGKKAGAWTEYVDNKIAFTGSYIAGKPAGEFIYYDRNGNELGKYTMKDGTGTALTFWANKKISSSTRMVRGVEEGSYRELTPRGRVVVEGSYRGGMKHGTWKEWTPDGVILVQQTWRRGKLHGAVKKFVDGKLSLEATYSDGQVAGVYTEHRNGKPAVTGMYVADRKDGTWTHYSADGAVILTATFKSGVLDGPWRQLVDGGVLEGTMTGGRRTGTWTLTDKTGAAKKQVY